MAMTETLTCAICRAAADAGAVETGEARSNVRRFVRERFRLWRCPACRSIHARDAVDLAAYYAHYPFFGRTLDGTLRRAYRGLLRRLTDAGLDPNARVLDYGCGSGLLTQFLRESGFEAVGYDPYSAAFADERVLARPADCLIAQDVIEHAEDPLDLLSRLDGLVAPGGLVFLGTPNASRIDLARAEAFVHPLHQPYHRHIFAAEALHAATGRLGWRLVRSYSTPYTNMRFPSLAFMQHYMRCFDDTLDALFERRLNSLKLWLNPKTYFLGLFGAWFCSDADLVAIYRTPK